MEIYNYDYSDMMDISLYNPSEKTVITSKVYPTKLEVKIDEETNRPYMHYEGIAQTNKGAMKVIFPKLDLVLDSVSVRPTIEDERDFFGFKSHYKIVTYKMTTEFNSIGDDSILYELRYLSNEDCKDIKKHFDEKYNK